MFVGVSVSVCLSLDLCDWIGHCCLCVFVFVFAFCGYLRKRALSLCAQAGYVLQISESTKICVVVDLDICGHVGMASHLQNVDGANIKNTDRRKFWITQLFPFRQENTLARKENNSV